jgi:hypothetical protein
MAASASFTEGDDSNDRRPRALTQVICSFAGSNLNVVSTDISEDLDAAGFAESREGCRQPVAIGASGSVDHSSSELSYTAQLSCSISASANASTVAAIPPPQ